MRRAFWDRFHVTPVTYLETCRLLLAKALLQDSSLSIAEITLASGFGSTRRLNELFQERYHLTPTALRRLDSSHPALGTLSLTLTYRPPYLASPLFDFLKGRAMKGIETVSEGIYKRTVTLCRGKRSALSWNHFRFAQQKVQCPHPDPFGLAASRSLRCYLSRIPAV